MHRVAPAIAFGLALGCRGVEPAPPLPRASAAKAPPDASAPAPAPPSWRRPVEVTAAPISEMPLSRNPPAPGAILLHDDYWPVRLLEHGGAEHSESLEKEPVARGLRTSCGLLAQAPVDVVTVDITLTRPDNEAVIRDSKNRGLAECTAKELLRWAGHTYLRMTLRVTARFATGVAEPPDADAARTFVCPNLASLEQDHSEAYWRAWEQMHPRPVALTSAGQRTVIKAPGGPQTWEEETAYRSPYGGCPAEATTGERTAIAWRSIGSAHVVADPAGGPFALHRAVTALRRAYAATPPPERRFVALDLARAELRRQRWADAARVLRDALATKGPPDDALAERFAQLLATALSHHDLEGAPEAEPATGGWPDLLDVEVKPAVVSAKMKGVPDRIDDPSLVPPEPAAKAAVLRWLVWELHATGLADTAGIAARRFLERFPLHRDAPAVAWEEIQSLIVQGYSHKPGTPAAKELLDRETKARAGLARYTGTTPWTEANRNDAEALARANELAKK